MKHPPSRHCFPEARLPRGLAGILAFSLFLGGQVARAQTQGPHEGFESGGLTAFEWITRIVDADGQILPGPGFEVQQDTAAEGAFAARSLTADEDTAARLMVTLPVEEGEIRFSWKVSSATDVDFVVFYIDGEEIDYRSGKMDWSEVSYPVSTGIHTFTWEYLRGGPPEVADDAAWVDAIQFPPLHQIEEIELGGTIESSDDIDYTIFYRSSDGVRSFLRSDPKDRSEVVRIQQAFPLGTSDFEVGIDDIGGENDFISADLLVVTSDARFSANVYFGYDNDGAVLFRPIPRILEPFEGQRFDPQARIPLRLVLSSLYRLDHLEINRHRVLLRGPGPQDEQILVPDRSTPGDLALEVEGLAAGTYTLVFEHVREVFSPSPGLVPDGLWVAERRFVVEAGTTCDLELIAIRGQGIPASSAGTPLETTVIDFEAALDSGAPDIQSVVWEFSIAGGPSSPDTIIRVTETMAGVTFHDAARLRMTIDFRALAQDVDMRFLNRPIDVRVLVPSDQDEDRACPQNASRGLFVFDASALANGSTWLPANPLISLPCRMGGCPTVPDILRASLANKCGSDPEGCLCPQGECTWVFNADADPVLRQSGRQIFKHMLGGFPSPGDGNFIALLTHDSKDRDRPSMFGDFRFSYDWRIQQFGTSLIETDGFGTVHHYPTDGAGGFLANSTNRGQAFVLADGGIRISHRGGTTFTYSAPGPGAADGVLVEIADRNANAFHLLHDATSGMLQKIVDPVGRQVLFESQDGLVTGMVFPDASRWFFGYAQGRLQTIQDPKLRTWTYRRDGERRIVERVNPAGQSAFWIWEPGEDRVQGYRDEQGNVTSMAYFPEESKTVITDAEGGSRTWFFDANGYPSRVEHPGGASSQEFAWSADGLILSVQGELDRTETWQYSEKGLPTRHERAGGEAQAWARNPSLDFEDLHVAANGAVTRVTLDARGNEVERVNQLQEKIVRTFNTRGQVLTERRADQGLWKYTYDPVQADLIATESPTGEITRQEFDALSRTTRSLDSAGRETRYGYLIHALVETITTIDGTRRTEFDLLYNPVKEIDVDGVVTSETKWVTIHGERLVAERKDALGHTVTQQFDTMGRPTVTLGPRPGQREEVRYDSRGRPFVRLDSLNHASFTVYNEDSTVAMTVGPGGEESKSFYDPLSGRLIRTVDPEQGEVRMSYTPSGQLARIEGPGPEVRETKYDALDRPFEEHVHLGDGRVAITKTGYGLNGEVVSATTGQGSAGGPGGTPRGSWTATTRTSMLEISH